ncbi:hypothetical protein GCM10009593_27940 [Microlunatus antarcticus]
MNPNITTTLGATSAQNCRLFMALLLVRCGGRWAAGAAPGLGWVRESSDPPATGYFWAAMTFSAAACICCCAAGTSILPAM